MADCNSWLRWPCAKRSLPQPCEEEQEEKGKRKKTSTNQELPDDILTQIFTNLPAAVVNRFRFTCKSWYSILSSSYFIKQHSLLNSPPNRKFLIAPLDDRTITICLCEEGSAFSFRISHPFGFTPLELRKEISKLRLSLRPAHGLSLLHSDNLVVVFNPFTRELLSLPLGSSVIDPQIADVHLWATVGLGFDPATRRHKVVRVYRKMGMHKREVYTLDVSYAWREIPLQRLFDFSQPPVFMRGALYWLQKMGTANPFFYAASITYFDVGEESFHDIDMPLSNIIDNTISHCLSEVGGRLCLAECRERENSVHFWLLMDDKSWDMWLQIDMDFNEYYHFCGELVFHVVDYDGKFIVSYKGKIFVYDPVTKTKEFVFSSLIHQVCTNKFRNILLSQYEETLCPVGRSAADIMISESTTHHIAMQVLQYLPVATILRFAAVCKPWRTLISSQRFIDSQFERTAGYDYCIRFAFFSLKTGQLCFVSLEDRDKHTDWNDSYSRLICSKPCHGLNLIASVSDELWTCNPCYGKYGYTMVEDPLFHWWGGQKEQWKNLRSPNLVGIGYDSTTKEHVVIRLIYDWESCQNGVYSMHCEVYELSKCRWALAGGPPYPVSRIAPPASVGRTVCWISNSLHSRRPSRVILAFDVLHKAFQVIPTPECGEMRRPFLVELKGHLCMVGTIENSEAMDVWMLKKDNIWVCEYRINLAKWPNYSLKNSNIVVPMHVNKHDGKILLKSRKEFGYYDPRTGEIETLHVISHNPKLALFLGAETLVPSSGVSRRRMVLRLSSLSSSFRISDPFLFSHLLETRSLNHAEFLSNRSRW